MLSSYFKQKGTDFLPKKGENVNTGRVVSEGVQKILKRNVRGKTWVVELKNGRMVKVSIENNNLPPTATSKGFFFEESQSSHLADIMNTLSKIPNEYLVAFEIVSDKDEDGLTLYSAPSFGSGFGHGSRNYINIITLSLFLILHEAGHAIEQMYRIELNHPTFLDDWQEAIEADDIATSHYGTSNAWEDTAEFAKIYAIALKTDRIDELRGYSPQRLSLWETVLNDVNRWYTENPLTIDVGEPFVAPEDNNGEVPPEETSTKKADASFKLNPLVIIIPSIIIVLVVLSIVFNIATKYSKKKKSAAKVVSKIKRRSKSVR